MSIPLHLASIKSSGVYRFIWDKSEVPPQQAETLRLIIGYSERGPFNTPVYVESKTEFANIFGKPSKRLERKGVYFHRIADQALSNGPILAFNSKKFTDESMYSLVGNDYITQANYYDGSLPLTTIYNTTKFWALDPDHLAEITATQTEVPDHEGTPKVPKASYMTLVTTDTKENSTTVFVRKTPKTYTTNYHLTIRSWFNNDSSEEIPTYLENPTILDTYLDDYFMDIFVFKGQFTNAVKSDVLSKYFYPSEAEVNKLWTGDASGEGSTGIRAQVKSALDAAVATGQPLHDVTGVPASNSITTIASAIEAVATLEQMAEATPAPTAKVKAALESLATEIENDIAPVTTGTGANLEPIVEYSQIREDYTDAFGQPADVLLALARDPNSRFVGSYRGIIFPYFKDANGSYISIDVAVNADYDAHKLMMKLNEVILDGGIRALTTFGTYNYNGWDTTSPDIPIYNDHISENYLQGYEYATLESTSSEQDYIASAMEILSTKGIHEALTNRVDVEYHYIVDSFKAYGTPANAAQHQKLAALASEKENALAIVNFPAIKDFGDSVINVQSRSVDMRKVVAQYPLPVESDGASFAAYYTPLLFSDGTVKNFVPSAGLVSNNFMAKYGARQPYYIVAGPTYGRLVASGLIGPEYGFSRSELDILEPAGINAIVYTPRLGTYINSNQTAKQTPVSALSKVHVRELVIFLTDEIAELLQNYQWELNTQELRDTIKAKADSILETVQHNGGVYDFLNICDSTNNPPEVIDNEMLVLDTHIEPARGAGKMVHQLTIHRTGEISSTIR
jgi:hypothetical protein